MNRTSYSIAFLLLLVLTGGCATSLGPPSPPALSTAARDQIGHMAVRGPTKPTVTLTANLDGKGAAAGKTAVTAGAGWLGGTMEAAGQSDEGGALVLALGLFATPFVAAGGAMYGAAVADSQEAVAEGNDVLDHALDFAPAELQRALESRLDEIAPVAWQFVPADVSDVELQQRGFDSVLDLKMESIASRPSDNDMHVVFTTTNRARLASLGSGQVLATRLYSRALPSRAVSSWARNGGDALTAALSATYASIATELTEELFVASAIRVKGLEPVSRNPYVVGKIPALRPLFVWSALDGGATGPLTDVEYELAISSTRDDDPDTYRVRAPRFVPPDNLAACRTYRWRVRAHFTDFGSPAVSDWTPEYRFKTPCDRG